MAFMTTEATEELPPMLLPVYLTVAYLFTATSSLNSFRRATDGNRTDFCATQQPSVTYDIDKLNLLNGDSVCLQPEALCSLLCTREPNCTSLNWNADTRRCALYFYSPMHCGYVSNCVHFQSTVCGQSSCGSAALAITADNEIKHLYFDGCQIPITDLPGRADWKKTDIVALPLTASLIAVQIFNPDSVGGLLASTDTLQTDDTWKLTTNYTSGWMNVNFDESTWKNATTYGYNGVAPWNGPLPGFSKVAQWITDEIKTAETVYFRYHIKRGNV